MGGCPGLSARARVSRLPLFSIGAAAFLAVVLLPVRADAALAYRRQITLLGAQVGATGAPHLNFPVLVSITDPTLRLAATRSRPRHSAWCDVSYRATLASVRVGR